MAKSLKSNALLIVILLITLSLGSCASPAQQAKSLLALYVAADNAYDQGDCATAIPLYRKLADAMRSDTKSLLRIGNCQSRAHNWTAAIFAYRAALQRDKSFVKAWYNLSYVQAQVLKETVAEMSQYVDPTNPVAGRIHKLAEQVLAPYGLSVPLPKAPSQPSLRSEKETDDAG